MTAGKNQTTRCQLWAALWDSRPDVMQPGFEPGIVVTLKCSALDYWPLGTERSQDCGRGMCLFEKAGNICPCGSNVGDTIFSIWRVGACRKWKMHEKVFH